MAFKSFVGGKVTTSEATIKKVTGKQIDYYISQNAADKIQDAFLSFKYYAYGAYMGTTYFYFHPDGGSPTQLSISANNSTYSYFSGQQQTSTGQAWRTATIDLSAFEGSPGKIVVRHTSVSDASNFFTGDFQMDDIKINCSNGQIVDLDPDLKRFPGTDNWERGQVNTLYSSSTWTDVLYQEDSNSFWCYDAGGTGSSNTGDTVDSDGSSVGYYLYTEVSGGTSWYNHLRTKTSYNLLTGAVVV